MNLCRAIVLTITAAALVACGSSPSRPSGPSTPVPSTRLGTISWTSVAEADDGSPIEVVGYRLACSASPGSAVAGRSAADSAFPAGTTSDRRQFTTGTTFCSIVAIAADGSISDPSNIATASVP